MPFYDLKCKCGEVFNVMASISDRENKRIKCPKCGGNELESVYLSVNVIHSPRKDKAQCPNMHRCGGCCQM